MKSNLLQLGLPSSQRRRFQPRQTIDGKKIHIHTHTGVPLVQNRTLNEQVCEGGGGAEALINVLFVQVKCGKWKRNERRAEHR